MNVFNVYSTNYLSVKCLKKSKKYVIGDFIFLPEFCRNILRRPLERRVYLQHTFTRLPSWLSPIRILFLIVSWMRWHLMNRYLFSIILSRGMHIISGALSSHSNVFLEIQSCNKIKKRWLNSRGFKMEKAKSILHWLSGKCKVSTILRNILGKCYWKVNKNSVINL